MTRFARSRGSKASNERVPEEATSWADMKQQLQQKVQEIEDDKLKKQADDKRREVYDKFLKERENDEFQCNAWADFPETITNEDKSTKKRKKFIKKETDGELHESQNKVNNNVVLEKSKKIKHKKVKEVSTRNEESGVVNEDKLGENDTNVKRKKRKFSKHIETQGNEGISNTNQLKISTRNKKAKITPSVAAQVMLQPEVTTPAEESLEEMSEEARKKLLKKKEKNAIRRRSRKELKRQRNKTGNEGINKASTVANINAPNLNIHHRANGPNHSKKSAKPKVYDPNIEHKRRKPKDETKLFTITEDGKECKLTYFDGFLIKTEDAERLTELRKQMISKGLRRSEVNASLKLERRRAEKALARDRKTICFNCRQRGHALSACPTLNNDRHVDTSSIGICFKCGSTEHTSFVCKLKSQEFKFASCFICKEQGHISWQCPDNARGLYPNGGGCKLCGDVTHLKKDCPQFVAEQQSNTMSLEIMNGSNPDSMGNEVRSVNSFTIATPRVNKIKF